MMASKAFKVQPWGVVVVVHQELPKDINIQPTTMGLTWTDPQDEFLVNVWLSPHLLEKPKPKMKAFLESEKFKFLVHECVHIKQFIEEAVETKLDKETEAYLIAELTLEVKSRL